MQKGSHLMRRREYFGLVFAAPWIIGFVFFFLYPLFHSLILSLSNFQFDQTGVGGYTTEFSGITNYIAAFTKDENFIQYLAESLLDIVVDVPICLVFSFLVAVLLKQEFRGNFIAKAIFFFPVILGTGVFLDVQTSISEIQGVAIEAAKEDGTQAAGFLQSVNIIAILQEIGVPADFVEYLTGPVDRIYSVISLSGVQIFIFLAGLNGISPSLYEATYIEGASGWECFWKITFPMVSPVIVVNIVYSLVDTFTSSANTTMEYIYDTAFSSLDYGLSCAMSWSYCLIMGVVVGLVMWFVSKKVVYQA